MTILLEENPGYSFSSATGNGVDVSIMFAFVGPPPGYIEKEQISVWVRVSDVLLPNYGEYILLEEELLYPSPNVLETENPIEAPFDGMPNIWVRRIQPKDATYADVDSNNIFRKFVLNNSFLNQLYIQHEVLDGFSDTGSTRGTFDMGNFGIINLQDGKEDGDAVNYGQTRTLIDESLVIQGEVQDLHDETEGYRDETIDNRDWSFKHASEGEDIPVDDGVNPSSFSAFHFLQKATEQADRAEAAANVAGAAVGEIKWYFTDHTLPLDREGMVMPLGQLLPKEGVYQSLWESVSAGQQPTCTEPQWQAGQEGCFVDYSPTQFRIPRLEGKFIRVPGTDDPEFNTRLAGGIQQDSIGPLSAVATFVGQALAGHTHTQPTHTHSTPNHTHTYSRTTQFGTRVGTGTAWPVSQSLPTSGWSEWTLISGHSGSQIAARFNAATTNTNNTGGGTTGSGGNQATGSTGAGTPAGTVNTTINGTDVETRPTNMYLQPYLVFSQSASGVGITLRGAWDANANATSGDVLNPQLLKGTPPTVEPGKTANGMGYVVVENGDYDLTDNPDVETYVVGDRVVWVGDILVGSWVHLKLGEVTSVNGDTGSVIVAGDTASIEEALPLGETIKEYIDRVIGEGIQANTDALHPINSSYVTFGEEDPNVTIGFVWELVEGNATLSFGDGSLQDGTILGSNEETLTVAQMPSHTHTTANHNHTFSATTGSNSGNIHVSTTLYNSGSGNTRTGTYAVGGTRLYNGGNSGSVQEIVMNNGNHTHSLSGTTGSKAPSTNSTGSGSSHNIQAARIEVNVWRRVS